MIVGNEPNLNRFWLPQFDEDGERRGRAGLLRAAHRSATTPPRRRRRRRHRSGAARSRPRGIDRPGTGRDTHSPTTFIRDLGAAYRASGREEPPLDGFAFHPVPGELEHPARPADRPGSTSIGLADYEEKLRPLLDEAFGPGLPVLYSELGVETAIPAGEGRALRRRAEVGNRSTRRRRPTTTAARSSSRPARRTSRPPALPLARRARPPRLPVRRLLRRRHAEDEPRARPRGDPGRG